jgi:hypothetical protein
MVQYLGLNDSLHHALHRPRPQRAAAAVLLLAPPAPAQDPGTTAAALSTGTDGGRKGRLTERDEATSGGGRGAA